MSNKHDIPQHLFKRWQPQSESRSLYGLTKPGKGLFRSFVTLDDHQSIVIGTGRAWGAVILAIPL